MTASSEFKIESLAPATRSRAVDPDSGDEFERGATLYVGQGGDIVLDAQRDALGTKSLFINVPSGSVLPVRVRKVYGSADGTTASNLVLIW